MSTQTAYYAMSESVEWYTPEYIWRRAEAVLGGIDCDPCSNPAPYNVPALVHYTRAENGLVQPWTGRVWMNPPFGKRDPDADNAGIAAWLDKLRSELLLGRCTEALVLTPGRTEARWFQHHWQSTAICFVMGRVQFKGSKKSGNTTGTVLSYWGTHPERFAAKFADLGQIVPLWKLGLDVLVPPVQAQLWEDSR